MRILYTESMGSEGRETRRVIEELLIIKEQGHQGWLVCRPNTWLYNYAKEKGVEVLEASFSNPIDIISTIKLINYILKYNIDIVHSHNIRDRYLALYATKLTGKKYVININNHLRKYQDFIYKMADLIITTGNKSKKELSSKGIDNNKIVSIPSYPDDNIFNPNIKVRNLEKSIYNTDGKLVIATLSGLNEKKRPHLILWALAVLNQRYDDIVYIVAGSDGNEEYGDKFYSLVKKYKLQDIVKYVGFVEAEKFLNIVDIYVSASEKEGIPQSIIEAMMMECAVVSTNVGSVTDLNVRNNILIVEDDDNIEKNMELMLEILISDREHLKKLARKNRELAIKFFNRKVMADLLIESYQKIISEN